MHALPALEFDRARKTFPRTVTPFWDIVMGTRWSEDHPLWLEWKKQKAERLAFDTLDGSSKSWKNDAFDAYDQKGPKAKLL